MTEFIFLNEATLEEQQEEVTVLQSIFQGDLQILQGEDEQGNICFTWQSKSTSRFNERIDFEAFVPIPGHEETIEEPLKNALQGWVELEQNQELITKVTRNKQLKLIHKKKRQRALAL